MYHCVTNHLNVSHFKKHFFSYDSEQGSAGTASLSAVWYELHLLMGLKFIWRTQDGITLASQLGWQSTGTS
jgi:hypothetical protein